MLEFVNGCNITGGGCNVTNDHCLDMTSSLAKYLESIPFDPNSGSTERTGYTVSVDSNNIVKVRACYSESTSNLYQAR